MNLPRDWAGFLRCPWPLKALALLGCLLLVPAMGHFLYGRSLVGDLELAHARQQQLQQQWREQSDEASAQEASARTAQVGAELEQARSELFDGDGLASLLHDLVRISSGLGVEQVAVDETITRPNFLEVPIRLRLSGDYLAVQRYLDELAGLKPLVTLRSLSLAARETEAGSLDIGLELRAYRALEPEPRAQAAEAVASLARDPFAFAAAATSPPALESAVLVGFLRDGSGRVALVRVGAVLHPLRVGDLLGAEHVAFVDDEGVGLVAGQGRAATSRVLRLGAMDVEQKELR